MAGSDGNEKQFSFLYLPQEEVANEIELHEKDNNDKCIGRKWKRNPDSWKVKHVKRPGLRKNSPLVPITASTTCCKKKCLHNISVSHLTNLRENFQTLVYDEQNVYLNGLLHRRETVKTSGHPRKSNPVASLGKRIGRPPAEESQFSFDYSLHNDKGFNVHVCQKEFCIVHGFGPKRLQVLRQKLESGKLELDGRGKHNNHPAVDDKLKDMIREHIKSVPSR